MGSLSDLDCTDTPAELKKNMHHFLISLKIIFLVIYNNNSFSSFPLFHILIQLNIVIAKHQG